MNSDDRSRSPSSSSPKPPLKKKRTSLAEVHAEAEDQEAEELNRQVDDVSFSYVNSVSPVVPHSIKVGRCSIILTIFNVLIPGYVA